MLRFSRLNIPSLHTIPAGTPPMFCVRPEPHIDQVLSGLQVIVPSTQVEPFGGCDWGGSGGLGVVVGVMMVVVVGFGWPG
jgi:hypothetical protein